MNFRWYLSFGWFGHRLLFSYSDRSCCHRRYLLFPLYLRLLYFNSLYGFFRW